MNTLTTITRTLHRHHQLVLEMALREIRDRYAGQVFGSIWAVGHPIFLMAIYLVIFNYIFSARAGGTFELPRDLTTYILSGLVPWLAFQDVLSRSPTAVSAHANLVKQVIFPVEILPVRIVISCLPNLLIGTVILVAYEVYRNQAIPWTYALFPLALLFQILAMAAIAFLFSSIGVFFRDLKEIVTVFNAANLFMMPVLFTPGTFPQNIELLFYFNPFSYMVWCYQDVFYYGRLEHPLAWIVFGSGSLLLLMAGAKIFLKTRPMFGNVL